MSSCRITKHALQNVQYFAVAYDCGAQWQLLGLRIRIAATKRAFLQVYGRSIGLRQALRRGLPSATLANQNCEDEDLQG